MAPFWGNFSRSVKEHIPHVLWNHFPMVKKRPQPRMIVAANIKALIEKHETTAPRVADQAGVDRKTLNNMLNGRFEPNLTNVEAVANVFGLSAWQLLRHDLHDSLVKASVVDTLIDDFYAATDDDRQKILGVAEMAAKYGRRK